MGRFFFALKTFFQILGSKNFAEDVKRLAVSEQSSAELACPAPTAEPKAVPKPVQRKRSEALTLLETLQREARLLDFVYEDISSYSDAQVGAAVREIHRGTRDVLARLFEVSPIEAALEGSPFEVQDQTDSARLRLLGNVTDARPLIGELVHAGWKAGKCELPHWTGKSENELILAPAEVEIR